MADEQQAKPSFKHAIAKKALAPLVATAATAVTTYLMRKAAELWTERVQPKVDEKGGVGAIAREAADAVSSKVAPVSEAVTSKVGGDQPEAHDAKPEPNTKPEPDSDRSDERRQRAQRRQQRRKTLEQTGSS